MGEVHIRGSSGELLATPCYLKHSHIAQCAVILLDLINNRRPRIVVTGRQGLFNSICDTFGVSVDMVGVESVVGGPVTPGGECVCFEESQIVFRDGAGWQQARTRTSDGGVLAYALRLKLRRE